MAWRGLDTDANAAILEALTRACKRGEPCPSNETLCAVTTRISQGTASKAVSRLASAGLIEVIRWHRHRAVRIAATGDTTSGWDWIAAQVKTHATARPIPSARPSQDRVEGRNMWGLLEWREPPVFGPMFLMFAGPPPTGPQEPTGCRWIHGGPATDKDWRYCNAPRAQGDRNYCPEHHKMAYRAVPPGRALSEGERLAKSLNFQRVEKDRRHQHKARAS